METRKIGSLDVTVVGLGCNNFGMRLDEARTKDVVLAALDHGINFFDTADVYGQTKSESFMGDAFGSRRDEAIIATKYGAKVADDKSGARPEYVRQAAEDSLKRLGVETIDLYQLHRPDADTPIADTLGAMNELVAEGKVREIGCSNFSVDQLREAAAALSPGEKGFASVQNQLSLLARNAENDVVPECERTGVAFLPFFPLYNGLLTGKYRRDSDAPEGARLSNINEERRGTVFSDKNLSIVESLGEFAESRGHTLLELAFSRLLAHPSIPSVIAGATSPEQVASNATAGGWKLSTDEIAEIDRLAPLPG